MWRSCCPLSYEEGKIERLVLKEKNQNDVPLSAKMMESVTNAACQKNCSKYGIIFTGCIANAFKHG